MQNRFAVFITWDELYGSLPTKEEVCDVLKQFNRQSTILLLARIGIHLFLERFRRKDQETIELQSFLIRNFWNDEVLDQAKKKLGSERLDFRRGFHLQQVLTLLKWAVLYASPTGGIEPDKDIDARYALGTCLLKASDLLLSTPMRDAIGRARQSRSPKRCPRVQLHVGAGNEINNPPPVVNAVVRNEAIFGEILRKSKGTFDVCGRFKERTGLSVESYVDMTLGALAIYLCRTQKELIDNPGLSVINPDTFFGEVVPLDQAQKYWQMESNTIEALEAELSMKTELQPQQDFTAFRMKPFLRLEAGSVVCVNPGFLQEKLEIGLFWTMVNSLEGEDRKKAFDTWGELFQVYISETFERAVNRSREKYIPFPAFSGKKHHHEAFDGMLLSDRICAVLECKGGFLPNKAKYAEEIDQFLGSLDQKFGSADGAGIEQLVRKIGQLFADDEKDQRRLADFDLAKVEVVIPVLIVQDNFVSSFLTIPWLARLFRDSMRKKKLKRNVVWTSLLVLHVEDVENLNAYIKAGDFSLSECLLFAGKKGDPGPGRLFAFADILREFLEETGITHVPQNEFDKKFGEIINRVTLRFFKRDFEPLVEPPTGGQEAD
jgi:hypothetical protein